jgi:hypothetical protein
MELVLKDASQPMIQEHQISMQYEYVLILGFSYALLQAAQKYLAVDYFQASTFVNHNILRSGSH